MRVLMHQLRKKIGIKRFYKYECVHRQNRHRTDVSKRN